MSLTDLGNGLMTDSSIADVPAFADALAPLERAALGLQEELSVFEIGLVTFPEKDAYPERKRLTDFLLHAIKAGRLAAYGDPEGWEVIEAYSPSLYRRTPYPRCDGHQGSRSYPLTANYDERPSPWSLRRIPYPGDWCLVTLKDYLTFLASPEARGIPKPDGWKAPQGEPEPLPQGEPEPLPQGEPDKPEQGAAATRQIALVEAEDAALATLRKELRREPDFEEFWCYIIERDDTGTIADYTNRVVHK